MGQSWVDLIFDYIAIMGLSFRFQRLDNRTQNVILYVGDNGIIVEFLATEIDKIPGEVGTLLIEEIYGELAQRGLDDHRHNYILYKIPIRFFYKLEIPKIQLKLFYFFRYGDQIVKEKIVRNGGRKRAI